MACVGGNGTGGRGEGGDFRDTTLTGDQVFGYEDRYLTLSPSLAGNYQWVVAEGVTLDGSSWNLFASYSRGVHYPGVYVSGISAATAARLEAETLDHVETGIGLKPADWIEARCAFFYDEGENMIQWTRDGMLNVGDYRTRGVEVTVNVNPVESIGFFTGVTWQRADPDEFPRLPEWSLATGATWRALGWLTVDVDYEYVDEQYAANIRAGAPAWPSFQLVEAYSLLNGWLSFTLPRLGGAATTLSVGVENVLDEEYEYQPGYPMPGTSVLGSIDVAF